MHAVCRADRSVQQFYPRQCCSNTSGAAAALPWTSPVTSETAAVLPQTWRWCYLRCDGRYDVLDIARSLYQPQQQTLWCHLSPSLWWCYHNHSSSRVTSDMAGAVSPQALPQPWEAALPQVLPHTWWQHSLGILGTWFSG